MIETGFEKQGEGMERIKVSENGRYLVTESGAPFFWLGDTAWELFHRLTLEEAVVYFERRQAQGFNVVQAVILAELDGLRKPNAYGDLPLVDRDPLQPNEAYFRTVDAMIDAAAARGLYVGVLPAWGDKVNLAWGIGPVIFDAANAEAYGAFLGSRYANRPNVIWILGGDRDLIADGVDTAPVWRAMAAGIRRGAGEHTLMTFHPKGWQGSSQTFHQDSWLDLNMWQSGHGEADAPNWEWISADLALTPPKPVLDGEPNYEDHGINPWSSDWTPEKGFFRDLDVRKQAYRSVFAGACGITYGHHAVWQMFDEGRTPINFPERFWRDALERPGAQHMIHLKRLMLARSYLNRIPDQTLIVNNSDDRALHMRATRAANGAWAMVYIPPRRDLVRIDLDRIAQAEFQIGWFDPRTGKEERFDGFGEGTITLAPPDSIHDWVLTIYRMD